MPLHRPSLQHGAHDATTPHHTGSLVGAGVRAATLDGCARDRQGRGGRTSFGTRRPHALDGPRQRPPYHGAQHQHRLGRGCASGGRVVGGRDGRSGGGSRTLSRPVTAVDGAAGRRPLLPPLHLAHHGPVPQDLGVQLRRPGRAGHIPASPQHVRSDSSAGTPHRGTGYRRIGAGTQPLARDHRPSVRRDRRVAHGGREPGAHLHPRTGGTLGALLGAPRPEGTAPGIPLLGFSRLLSRGLSSWGGGAGPSRSLCEQAHPRTRRDHLVVRPEALDPRRTAREGRGGVAASHADGAHGRPGLGHRHRGRIGRPYAPVWTGP